VVDAVRLEQLLGPNIADGLGRRKGRLGLLNPPNVVMQDSEGLLKFGIVVELLRRHQIALLAEQFEFFCQFPPSGVALRKS
jgi:hypothetical protein